MNSPVGTQVILASIFQEYVVDDVWLALNISDLWLPNISSMVKHYFAFQVLASVDPSLFSSDKRLECYEKFRLFIERVHSALPSLGMLEDYVPETDWGEIRIPIDQRFSPMFYGSNVERLPDFVEAFRMVHSAEPDALNDIDYVIDLQAYIINAIDRSVVGTAEGVTPGHIEIPLEGFWSQCTRALTSLSSELQSKRLSDSFALPQGAATLPVSWDEFGENVLSGSPVPAVIVRTENGNYPIAARTALSIVMDYWARNTKTPAPLRGAPLAAKLSRYIRQRIPYHSIISGPVSLRTRSTVLPYTLAGVISSRNKFYLIMPLQRAEVNTLPKKEADIHALLSSPEEWAFQLEDSPAAIQLRHKDGRLPHADEVVILAIIAASGTAPGAVTRPNTKFSQIIFLSDAISLFDALNDADELDRFWTYVDQNEAATKVGAISVIDYFASFRASHGVLVEGANTPDIISLDPHWGSNWRFHELEKFWRNAPALFPGDGSTAWKIEPVEDGIQQLISRSSRNVAWSTCINGCVIHLAMSAAEEVDTLNLRLLELILHCLADVLYMQRDLIDDLPIFKFRRIVLRCQPNFSVLAREDSGSEDTFDIPLFSDWQWVTDERTESIASNVRVSLVRVKVGFADPTDARFEVESLAGLLEGILALSDQSLDGAVKEKLLSTGSRLPRYTITGHRRRYDAPDFAVPRTPKPEQYKLARRELAILFQNQGLQPGRYELQYAKHIIDQARDAFRSEIHWRISSFNRAGVLHFAIQQHDALIIEYRNALMRLQNSMHHEVSYDRTAALSKAYDKYLSEGRNLRYMLECCLSIASNGAETATSDAMIRLTACIDWLLVLYSASDILHNGIEPGGIELDDNFVPVIFYRESHKEDEKAFGLERAGFDLGISLDAEEEALTEGEFIEFLAKIDEALLIDAGFSMRNLLRVLTLLTKWRSARDSDDYHLSYLASREEIASLLVSNIEGVSREEIDRIVSFATLHPEQIRRLLGKTVDESDVPVWDHNKRGARFAIRPLVPVGPDHIEWGAASVHRSISIWKSSVERGYLPADFAWPQTQKVFRSIKEHLESRLETQALRICSKFAQYILPNVDFMHRFPAEGFDDVGDFDVIAYWPEGNRWLIVECKYNQQPFCLKDARRLRDRIFGPPERGQFTKIERRRAFLQTHSARLRALLSWPVPTPDKEVSICEIYVSREIYWWMRNPPYVVPTHFVRIDALDAWLRSSGVYT